MNFLQKVFGKDLTNLIAKMVHKRLLTDCYTELIQKLKEILKQYDKRLNLGWMQDSENEIMKCYIILLKNSFI